VSRKPDEPIPRRRRKNHYVRIRDRLKFWSKRLEIRRDARKKRMEREGN
jgi:hypothetical protein